MCQSEDIERGPNCPAQNTTPVGISDLRVHNTLRTMTSSLRNGEGWVLVHWLFENTTAAASTSFQRLSRLVIFLKSSWCDSGV